MISKAKQRRDVEVENVMGVHFLGSNISGTSRSYNLTAAGFCLFTLLGRCTIVVLKLVYCLQT